MTQQPLLKLGTLRSPLALAQAEETRARLCAAHGWDSNAVELVPVVASGDKVQDRALAEIGGLPSRGMVSAAACSMVRGAPFPFP